MLPSWVAVVFSPPLDCCALRCDLPATDSDFGTRRVVGGGGVGGVVGRRRDGGLATPSRAAYAVRREQNSLSLAGSLFCFVSSAQTPPTHFEAAQLSDNNSAPLSTRYLRMAWRCHRWKEQRAMFAIRMTSGGPVHTRNGIGYCDYTDNSIEAGGFIGRSIPATAAASGGRSSVYA